MLFSSWEESKWEGTVCVCLRKRGSTSQWTARPHKFAHYGLAGALANIYLGAWRTGYSFFVSLQLIQLCMHKDSNKLIVSKKMRYLLGDHMACEICYWLVLAQAPRHLPQQSLNRSCRGTCKNSNYIASTKYTMTLTHNSNHSSHPYEIKQRLQQQVIETPQ